MRRMSVAKTLTGRTRKSVQGSMRVQRVVALAKPRTGKVETQKASVPKTK